MKVSSKRLLFGFCVFFLSIYSFTRGGVGLMISQSMWSIGLLSVLAVSVLLILSKSIRTVPKADLAIIFMILEIILWNNNDFKHGVWFLDFILIVFLVFILAANKTDVWFDFAIKMILFMGLFHAFWTIACFLNSDIYFTIVYPVVNNIAQWNLIAMYNKGFMTGFNYSNSQDAIYLTSGLVASCAMIFFHGNSERPKIKDYLLIAIMVFCLLLTGKRGPIVWFAVAFIVVYWLYNCDKPTSRAFKIAAIIVFTIAVVYVTSFVVSGVLNFVYRFIEMAEQGDITTHRTELWGMGFNAFLKRPILGNGWFWFKYNNTYGTTYHVHNCYVQWLCELGIVGSLPWFVFVISNFSHTVKMIIGIKKQRVIDFNENALRHLSFSALYQCYFLIFAFAATSFYEPECVLPYFFSCGITMYYWSYYKNYRKNNLG